MIRTLDGPDQTAAGKSLDADSRPWRPRSGRVGDPAHLEWRMKSPGDMRARFIRDDLPVRLGNLASNLSRIGSFAETEGADDLIRGLLRESEYFIEWTADDASLETQCALVELQVLLARWLHGWERISTDLILRREVSRAAQEWSDRVLAMSGLLSRQPVVREKRP